jgi:DNA polymerase elongation subunit (family B)
MTKEEILERIKELKMQANDLFNEEQAIKLTMNSIYGAIGNNFFVCFNTEVAKAVTLQGQDLFRYAEKVMNKYFNEFWHKDVELHEKLGLTEVKPIQGDFIIYGDTDSNYVSFENVVKSCDWQGNPLDLVLKINEYRLDKYLKTCFQKYAEKWRTENHQDFELETISHAGLFLGKKKYILDIAYDSGVRIESLKKIKTTGVEMVKGGTPPFVREKLMFLTRYIFEKGKSLKIKEFIQLLKKIKQEFKMQDPANISMGIQVNNIEKFILNDSTGFEYGKGCPIHVRAAGYHNYVINNSKFKDKYSLIKSGDKIKYYFVKTKNDVENNIFGYGIGNYPYEVAPPMDFDTQFTKTILDPINRFVEAMGLPLISQNLFIMNPLF